MNPLIPKLIEQESKFQAEKLNINAWKNFCINSVAYVWNKNNRAKEIQNWNLK